MKKIAIEITDHQYTEQNKYIESGHKFNLIMKRFQVIA
jgi:hypothetical protein